jgi:tyrosinase
VLEGMPHNKIHNYIGGVGNLGPGPFGVMTNNLSPIDPIFFLHHSNMDRLWDVWTRKQKSLDLPYLPSPTDAPVFSKEQFLFFVNAKGQYVGESLAGDYLDMDRWEYDYEPGFGEKLVHTPKGEQEASKRSKHLFLGTLKNNGASATVPNDVAKNQNADTIEPSMFVQVTIPRSAMTEGKREFDVIVGAPPNATDIGPDSPYFAGTISLFGGMHMKGMTGGDATFTIPVPRKISPMVTAPKGAAVGAAGSSSLSVRVVPSGGHGKAPAIREIVVAVR